jgi:hypothetical protein
MIGLSTAWHALRLSSSVVQLQMVKTVRKTLNMIIPKSKVAFETWLAELRRMTALSDMGAVFLSLQISQLENKCAALRKRVHPKAKPVTSDLSKKRPLRTAA